MKRTSTSRGAVSSSLVVLLLPLLLAACGGGGAPRVRVARIEITPGGVLFTGAGQTHALSAQAYDAAGHPLDTVIHWTSSDPSVVGVDTAGSLTATAALGSALVTATADGVDSFPASVIVADPVDGALLVPDAAILEPPSPVSGSTGGELQVVITGFGDLAVGDVVVASEGTPLLGRVTALESAAEGTRVRYVPVPFHQAFDRIAVDADFDLASADPVLDAALVGKAAIERREGGTFVVTSRTDAPLALKAPTCEGSASGTQIQITQLSTKLTNDLHFRVGVRVDAAGSVAEAHAYVDGSLQQEVSSSVSANAGLSGTYACTLELLSIPIPVDEGLITAVVHPEIPVGATVSVTGTLKSLSAKLSVQATPGFTTKVGFGYDAVAGATVYHDFKPTDAAPHIKLDTTTPEDYRAELEVFGGLASGVKLKLGMVEDVDILTAKLGGQQAMSLAPVGAQAKDTAYASAYDLSLVGTVGVGADLSKLMGWLGVSVTTDLVSLNYARPLSKSPQGSLAVDAADVGVGQSAHVTIELDPDTITYLTHPNVKEVRVYVLHGDEAPKLVDTVETNASNQTTYQATWNTLGFDTGDYTVVGFVVDDLLSTVATIPLEVAANSGRLVHVTGVCTASVGLRPLGSCAGGTRSTLHTVSSDGDSTMTVVATDIALEPTIDPNSLHILAATLSLDWVQHSTASGCTETAHLDSVRVTNQGVANYVIGAINYYPDGVSGAPPSSYMAWGGAQNITAEVQHSCTGGGWTSTENFEAWLFATPQYFDRAVTPWPVVQVDDVIAGSATVVRDQNGATATLDSSWTFLVPGVRAPG